MIAIRSRGQAGAIALLLAQPVIFYRHVLITATAHIPYDIETYHYPLIAYLARSLRQGVAPLWDPYIYCGVPVHSDLQAQFFYPFTWIAALLGNLSAGRNLFYWVEWLVPLHMMLAGLFTYALLRRMDVRRPAALLGASVFQLGGFFASQACHLGAISTAAWLPLAALGVYELRGPFRARWFAILTLALAMSILAGYAPTTIVVFGGAAMFLIGLIATREASWRAAAAFVGAIALAGAIAAVELIPLWLLTQESIASLRSQWLGGWGAPIESLMSLVWPNYYHIFEPLSAKYTLPYNYTFLYVYCGIAPLALLVAAAFVRRARVFFALAAVSALWMLGEHTPVYPFVTGHLPNLIRGSLYAWYAMMAFCFFVGIAAAMALNRLGSRVPVALLWALALFTSWDLIHTGSDRPMNAPPGGYRLSTSEYQIRGYPGALDRLHALVDVATPPLRIDYVDTTFWPGILGANMLALPTPDGDIPFMSRRLLLLRRLFCGGKPSERNLPVTRTDSPLLPMLNVGYLGSWSQVNGRGLALVGQIAGQWIYRVPKTLPRFFLVPRVRRSNSEAETFRMLGDGGFNPAEEAIVEGVLADQGDLATGEVRVAEYAPTRIRLETACDRPAFLATSESSYPGWQATVNGVAAPLLMTNGAFRGLFVGAGKNRIEMTYHPRALRSSLGLSIAALLLTLLALTRRRPADRS